MKCTVNIVHYKPVTDVDWRWYTSVYLVTTGGLQPLLVLLLCQLFNAGILATNQRIGR